MKKLIIASFPYLEDVSGPTVCSPNGDYDACRWYDLGLRHKYENPTVLLNSESTRDNILNQFTTSQNQLASGDTIVFVWVGHGQIDVTGDDVKHELLTFPGKKTRFLTDRDLLETADLRKDLNYVFIFDACQVRIVTKGGARSLLNSSQSLLPSSSTFMSGLVDTGTSSESAYSIQSTTTTSRLLGSRLVIASCRPGEESVIRTYQYHSSYAFSYYLRSAIELHASLPLELLCSKTRHALVRDGESQCPTAMWSGAGHCLTFSALHH